MITKRIIPCLDIKAGRTVKGTNFENLRDAGDPLELAIRYEAEGADELVFLDISATNNQSALLIDLVKNLSKELSIPFSVGGGIATVDQAYQILQNGADKISVNSAAVKNPNLITELAQAYGNQCIILAVDVKKINDQFSVFTNGGKINAHLDALDWVKEAESRGAGEILCTSMDHDGTKNGFAIDLLTQLGLSCNLPLIASGGAGKIADFIEVLDLKMVDAALAASVFHYQEIEILELKKRLFQKGLAIRI